METIYLSTSAQVAVGVGTFFTKIPVSQKKRIEKTISKISYIIEQYYQK